jgi:hypothetical protein
LNRLIRVHLIVAPPLAAQAQDPTEWVELLRCVVLAAVMSEHKQEAINKILALDEGAQGELMVLINTGMGMFKDPSQQGDAGAVDAASEDEQQSHAHAAPIDSSAAALDVSASASSSSSFTPSTSSSASSASTARLRQLEAEHAELQQQV